MSGNRFIERAVIDEVIYELMQLSGQEYVDIYAATLKKGAEAAPEAPGKAAPGKAAKPGGADQPPARIPKTAAG